LAEIKSKLNKIVKSRKYLYIFSTCYVIFLCYIFTWIVNSSINDLYAKLDEINASIDRQLETQLKELNARLDSQAAIFNAKLNAQIELVNRNHDLAMEKLRKISESLDERRKDNR
jgi:predicted PurR-regulated permease PerM